MVTVELEVIYVDHVYSYLIVVINMYLTNFGEKAWYRFAFGAPV
jgi:hypothetical protein